MSRTSGAELPGSDLTGRCVPEDDLLALVDEQLSVERARVVQAHLEAGCASCGERVARLRALSADVASPAAPADDPGFAAAVAARFDERPTPWWRRSWSSRWLQVGAMAAAAAVVALVVLPALDLLSPPPAKDRGTFRARGGAPAGKLVSLTGAEVLVVSRGSSSTTRSRPPLRPGATLGATEGLALRYTNLAREPLYLLAFALDTAGDVHWLYPAYTDPASDPRAVRLAPRTRDRALPEVVAPEGCPAGALRVVVAIGRRPATVKQVERLLAGRRPDAALTNDGFWSAMALQQWLVRCAPAVDQNRPGDDR